MQATYYKSPALQAQHSSKTDQHFTPSHLVTKITDLMGGIDLDPASCEKANSIVGATEYFDRKDNGLRLDWFDNVYCNPPGGKQSGQSLTKLFWLKLVHEYRAARVKQAVFMGFNINLLSTYQETARDVYHLVCIPRRRIRFLDESLKVQPRPTQANAIIWVPPLLMPSPMSRKLFHEFFGSEGMIFTSSQASD